MMGTLRYILEYKPIELAHSLYSLLPVSFCLYSPLNYISFQQFSVFSLCSSGLISAILVHSAVYLCIYEIESLLFSLNYRLF